MNEIKVIIAFVFIVSLGYSQKVTTYREHFFETDTLKAIKDKVKEISDKGQSININVYKFSNFILPNKKGYLAAYDLMDKIVDVQKSIGMVNRNMLLVEDMHERIVEYTDDYIVFMNGSKIDTLREIENSKKIVTRIKLARNNKLPADTLALKKIDSLSERQITFKYDDDIKKDYNASVPKKIREILEVLEVLEKPSPGDPLMEMRIQGTREKESENRLGGTYGCKRYSKKIEDQNCKIWLSKIPGMPKEKGGNKIHDGIDLSANTNTPVYAMYDGTFQAGWSDPLGNRILITSTKEEHQLSFESNTITISYGHLSSYKQLNGEKIKQGQLIGYTGNSGSTAENIGEWQYHLHLTVYSGDAGNKYNRTNPMEYITTNFDKNGNNN